MRNLRFEVSIFFATSVSLVIFSAVSFFLLKTYTQTIYQFIWYVEKTIAIPYGQESYPAFTSKIKPDVYQLHLKVAVISGIPLLKDDENLSSAVKTGIMTKVKNQSGYKIHRLQYSKAFLSRDAYSELITIGELFDKETNGKSFFTVTSLTRTVVDQKRLAKHNRNATKGISTHSYGVSFDISYIRFNGRKRYDKMLTEKLEKILVERQHSGKIYVLREIRSHCYHITVR